MNESWINKCSRKNEKEGRTGGRDGREGERQKGRKEGKESNCGYIMSSRGELKARVLQEIK